MKRSRRRLLLAAFCALFLSVGAILLRSTLFAPPEDPLTTFTEQIAQSVGVRLEARNDPQSILLWEKSYMSSLPYFSSLVEYDQPVSEDDWLYKVTFNPREIMFQNDLSHEIIVLVGPEALSIDGVSFTATNGSYPQIVKWFENKYQYAVREYGYTENKSN